MTAKGLKWPKWVATLGATAMALGLLAGLAAAAPPTDPPGESDHAIVPLGKALDTDGREVEGFGIIHFKEGFGHKPGHDKGGGGSKGGGGKGGGETCFAFLAKGARWKTTEPYVVDPSNTAGLGETTVRSLTSTSLDTWDTEVAFDIFGAEGAGTVDGIDTVSPDGKNEVLFGDVGSSGAIAVTIVWGFFGGPPFARELVEWDALFDDVDFDWSTSGEAGKMDFQNIATHEFGHSAGMGHPEDSCTEETMYRFASAGETKKRAINAGDIAGINKLYK